VATFFTNRGMFSLYRSCRFQRRFPREWLQSLSFSWPQELLTLPIVLGVVTVAYSLNDQAWSLAVTTAATLLVPLEHKIDRFFLDVIMRKRASAAPAKAQVPVSELIADGSFGGATKRPRTRWVLPFQRLVNNGESPSVSGQTYDMFPPRVRHLHRLLQLLYVAAACFSVPSSRLEVVAGIAIILVGATAFGFFPNPRGSGRIFATSSVKVIAALLFLPQELVLGVGIGSFVGYYVLLRGAEAWRAANTASAWGLSAGAAAVIAHFALSRVTPYAASVTVAALLAVIVFRTINEGVWALQRTLFLGYPFPSEWGHGVFARWGLQTLDVPAAVGGALVAHHFGTVGAALATTAASVLLVPLARWELGHQYDRTVSGRAAALLWQSETRFRALAEQLSEGVSLINAEGTILYFSPSALKILGYRSSNHVGRSWFEMHHPEDAGRLKSLFSSMIRDPGSYFPAETRILHRDGAWRWVHAVHTNLLMEPSVQAIVVTYHDITQVRRSEETLEEYAARLEDLSRRLVQAQEMERRRVAQELHDETGQILTGLKLTLDVASKQIGESEAKSTLSRATVMLETLQKHMRTLSLNLRPTALDDLGLLPAILLLCDQYTAQTSVRVKVIHSGISGKRFAAEIETTAYRIVQESLTNVARHASVPEATIRLWTDEEILGIQVEDCGQGFNIESAKSVDRSSGITGMRERVSLVGGEFTIESTQGVGTRLTAELPFRRSRSVLARHES
jgi:PAS domain S-box-containing protein